MPKKIKLNLDELHIQSFVTSRNRILAGQASSDDYDTEKNGDCPMTPFTKENGNTC